MKIRLLAPNAMKKVWFIIISTLAISCGFLAAPLRAEFAYVANVGDDTVSAYSIARKTGALTPVPGSPFPTGLNPVSVAITRH